MEQKEQNNLQPSSKSKSNPKLKLIIFILITAVLFIADLYVMINQPKNMVLLAAVTVLILISLYMVIDSVLKLALENKGKIDEYYDNIFKSEKASYLLSKKIHEEMSNVIQNTNTNAGNDNSEEIINAQKAIAKLTINRSKENADAIMNSNDNILNMIIELEHKIDENRNNMIDYQEKFSKSFNEDVIEKQDRLFIELNNMEASLNNSLLGLSEKVSGFQEEIERLADHIERINTEAVNKFTRNVADIRERAAIEESVPEDSVLDDLLPEASDFGKSALLEESSLEDFLSDSELSLGEEEPEAESDDLPDLSDSDKAMTAEEIEALIAGTLGEIGLDLDNLSADPELPGERELSAAEAAIEEPLTDELLIDEPLIDEPLTDEPLIDEPLTDEPLIDEQKAEEKPEMPDLSNPNKVMTPEEIAALIANM